MVFRPCRPKKKNVPQSADVVKKDNAPSPELNPSGSTEDDSVAELGQLQEMADMNQSKAQYAKKGTQSKNRYHVLNSPPSAREAAFGGPPRYDWIDVETAAAIKVQSKFRQLQVQRELEKQGITTSGQRNRSRARKSKKKIQSASEDVPFLVSMCGIGNLFGMYDDDNTENKAKEREMRMRQEKEATREAENQARIHNFQMKQKRNKEVLESLEVVEDVV